MFGEIQLDAQTLAGFLASLMFVIVLIEKVNKMFGKKDIEKREISFSETYASKAELTEVRGQVVKLEAKIEHQTEMIRCEMKDDKTEILRAGEDRAVKLHDRINLVLEKVSELRGANEEQHRRMGL